jgi:hypothetical protein
LFFFRTVGKKFENSLFCDPQNTTFSSNAHFFALSPGSASPPLAISAARGRNASPRGAIFSRFLSYIYTGIDTGADTAIPRMGTGGSEHGDIPILQRRQPDTERRRRRVLEKQKKLLGE